MRGIALILVVGFHYGFTPFLGGVDLFFVLSGFLIGGILLDNKEAPNFFKAFYVRRVCRIFPLYFLVLFLFFVIVSFVDPGTLRWLLGDFHAWLFENRFAYWSYATFIHNFVMAHQGFGGPNWLTVTWSLAVEEQFYLLLPFLIRFISRKTLPYIFVALILAAPLLRLAVVEFLPKGGTAFYVLMPCRMDALLLGTLCAYVVRYERILDLLRSHTRALYGALAILITGTVIMVMQRPDPVVNMESYFPPSYGYTWLAVMYSCVVLLAVTEERGMITWITTLRPLRMLAVVAFGVFLFHMPIQGLLRGMVFGTLGTGDKWLDLAGTAAAIPITLALATLSWHFFEKRFVNWARRSFKYAKSPTRYDLTHEVRGEHYQGETRVP